MDEVTGTAVRTPTLDAASAATYLAISESTLKRLCREGKGPKHARISRVLAFRKADLDIWLEKQFDEPAAKPKKKAAGKSKKDLLAA